MCGLTGVAGSIDKKIQSTLKDLIQLNTIRGRDSTGVAVVPKSGLFNKSSIFKMPVSGYEFINTKKVDNMMPTSARCIIGHNRAATVGGVNQLNAHPFSATGEDTALIGAHNGTLDYYSRDDLDPKDKFGTDSEALFHTIAQKGPATLTEISGAWALTWWDYERDRLYMIKNDERPLSYLFTKDRKTLIWASEYDMMYWAANRNSLEVEEASELMDDTLYEFYIPELSSNTIEDPGLVGEYKPKPTIDYTSYNTYTGRPEYSSPRLSAPAKTTAEVIQMSNGFETNGAPCNCAWCNAEMARGEGLPVPKWFSSADQFICAECQDDSDVQAIFMS